MATSAGVYAINSHKYLRDMQYTFHFCAEKLNGSIIAQVKIDNTN